MVSEKPRTSITVFLILAGMAATIMAARWIDRHRPAPDPALEEEKLYLAGNIAKSLSLGFNGLVADWYWMRSLQYVGRKIMKATDDKTVDDLGQLQLGLLAPLLDTATTLDPQFMEAYEYSAVVLPSTNVNEAIRITRKGMAANPSAWRLYQHLGYIFWQLGDYQKASECYGDGAKLPGAPPWMEAMKARMAMEGGSIGTAREIYTRIYELAGESNIKEMARRRLMQLDSLEQRAKLRGVLMAYKNKVGHCASSWVEVTGMLRTIGIPLDSKGSPLDPSGSAYLIGPDCDVVLDPNSEVPAK